MKNQLLLFCFAFLSSSNLYCQSFFVDETNSSVKSLTTGWLVRNGYKVHVVSNGSDFVVKFETSSAGKRSIISANVLEADIIVAVGESGQSKTIQNSDYVDALQSLSADLKKLKTKITQKNRGVFFKDTLVLTRKKRPDAGTVNVTLGGNSTEKYQLRITKISGGGDLTNSPLANDRIWRGGEVVDLNFLIPADTTIKDGREHKYSIEYKKTDEQYYQTKPLFVTVNMPMPKEEILPIKNDIIFFIGTTIDPNNAVNKVRGVSIEGFIPFQITDKAWMRIGGYFHPNFSRDSVSHRRTDYYRIQNDPNRIGRQTSRIDIAYPIESIGMYLDLFWPLNNTNQKFKDKDLVRIAPFAHFEWVRRLIEPKLAFNAIRGDTILKTSVGSDTKIMGSKPDAGNFLASKMVRTQIYMTFGTTVETNFKNVYALMQLHAGLRQEFVEHTVSILPDTHRYLLSANIKLSARYKSVFNLSGEVRDIFTRNSYINISAGIPINVSDLFKKKDPS